MATTLNTGERAQRKTLITVAAWGTVTSGVEANREILGTRTEDSSIELNADVETSTDILGNNYTDVNKTQPQQDFDPFYLLGGSDLGEYLLKAVMENDIAAYNNVFTVYVITAIIDSGTGQAHAYKAVKHTECSIIPTAVGGDSYVNMPIEVHYSNKITVGTVDKLSDDFTFTPTVSL